MDYLLTFPLLPVISQDYIFPFLPDLELPRLFPGQVLMGPGSVSQTANVKSRGGQGLGFSREKSHGSWRAQGPMLLTKEKQPPLKACPRTELMGWGWLSLPQVEPTA